MQAALKHGAVGLKGAPLQPPLAAFHLHLLRWACSLFKDSPTSSELDSQEG